MAVLFIPTWKSKASAGDGTIYELLTVVLSDINNPIELATKDVKLLIKITTLGRIHRIRWQPELLTHAYERYHLSR